MKVTAYQAPLLLSGSTDALGLIRRQIDRFEAEDVDFLLCPEAVLGGLADYAEHPEEFALTVGDGQLESAVASLASDSVTTIVAFTEPHAPWISLSQKTTTFRSSVPTLQVITVSSCTADHPRSLTGTAPSSVGPRSMRRPSNC